MLLYISVPDKFVHNRRNVLFLKTLTEPDKNESEQNENFDSIVKKVTLEEKEYSLDNLSMSLLMDLSLDDLRDLDRKVGLYDNKK